MKLMDLIRPLNTQKKHALESELEAEKLRLLETTDRAAASFRSTVSQRRWFNEHPLETTMLIVFGGYCIAKWVDMRHRARLP